MTQLKLVPVEPTREMNEVKRFTIGTFHAAIVSAGSECVLASDYDALLAERNALRKDAERLDRLDIECEAYGCVGGGWRESNE